MPAGYSLNPLVKKLGIKEGYRCLIINEPDNYVDLLEEIPAEAEFTDQLDGPFDFIHVFITSQTELENQWSVLKSVLVKTGSFWISWPKKTSPLATELNGNFVREFGLKGGL